LKYIEAADSLRKKFNAIPTVCGPVTDLKLNILKSPDEFFTECRFWAVSAAHWKPTVICGFFLTHSRPVTGTLITLIEDAPWPGWL
jgi:hypothetical protein